MPANYVLLGEVTVGAAGAASVTISNIPQTGYTDLKLVYSMRTATSAIDNNVLIEFNAPSGGGFSLRSMYGTGSAAGSFSRSSGASTDAGYAPGSTATASTFANNEIYIPNYTSANNKSFSVDSVAETNSANVNSMIAAGLWSNTAAITSIKITDFSLNAISQYSTFYLYGLAAVGTTPVIAPFATGGDVITNDGTYWIHTFLSSGTFTPQKALTCDALVVAGGGGAGRGGGGLGRGGGGGGAGGFRTSTGLSATVQAYAITVGAGGAGVVSGAGVKGGTGSDSIFSTITSSGGGGGGQAQALAADAAGNPGGSGGGGTANGNASDVAAGGAGNTPSTSPSQGNNGGSVTNNPTFNKGSGAGGGGSSAVGANGLSNSAGTITGGAGGAGTANSYSGSSVTYAAGGAGGDSNGTTNGSAGTANIGNGGQGGQGGATTVAGGNGGSGVVIIRYPIA